MITVAPLKMQTSDFLELEIAHVVRDVVQNLKEDRKKVAVDEIEGVTERKPDEIDETRKKMIHLKNSYQR